jgi:hypothetical protein
MNDVLIHHSALIILISFGGEEKAGRGEPLPNLTD